MHGFTISLTLVVAVAVAALLGVKVVGINEGQLGVYRAHGASKEELLPPGIYIHVPRFRHIDVVNWGQIRVSRFSLLREGKNGERIRQSIWLQWSGNSEKVAQFYLATHAGDPKSNSSIEFALIQSKLDVLAAPHSADLTEIRDKLRQALDPQGFVIRELRLADVQ
jgi:hypothetical protein